MWLACGLAEDGAVSGSPDIQICSVLEQTSWLLNHFCWHFHYSVWLVTVLQISPLLQTAPSTCFLHLWLPSCISLLCSHSWT